MISDKEYNDFKNANLIKDGLPEDVSSFEVVQKLQQKVEDLEEEIKKIKAKLDLR